MASTKQSWSATCTIASPVTPANTSARSSSTPIAAASTHRGFDWSSAPVDTGAPLSQDYNVIESNEPNPVAADLDGDGNLELLFSSYDGRVHAFWLDKTEHGAWPYSVYSAAEGTLRFASEPTVADLDNDGHAEVIFASWTQIGRNKTGKLHILDYLGTRTAGGLLPPAFGRLKLEWGAGSPNPGEYRRRSRPGSGAQHGSLRPGGIRPARHCRGACLLGPPGGRITSGTLSPRRSPTRQTGLSCQSSGNRVALWESPWWVPGFRVLHGKSRRPDRVHIFASDII